MTTSRRHLLLLLGALAAFAFTSGVAETIFNNLLSERYGITATGRGWLEFPRELPGFLVAAGVGALAMIAREPLMAAAATGLVALGLAGLAHASPTRGAMIAFMVVWSSGVHILIPVQGTLALRFAEGRQRGRLIGRLGGIGNIAVIAGCVLVWILWRMGARNYALLLTIAAGAGAIGMVLFAFLRPPALRLPAVHPPRRFLFRRQYVLFYVLDLLFGARKQVFLTFGPWVIVKVFGGEPDIFAKLWILAHIIGIPAKPLIGWAVDRFGERAVLVVDAALEIAVCLTYAFAGSILAAGAALWVVCAAYVLDQLLFAMQMARTTYLDKIAVEPDDITPTLSLGVSINHAVAMTIPILGGWAWSRHGYPSVFLFAAGVALMSLVAATRIRTSRPPGPASISRGGG